MKKVKVVIGANFGDEGKGHMTDYFAYEALKKKENCIVVCCNGGSQRGHTVVTPEGKRFVFHHFGSGIFARADTWLSKHFIVNPLNFVREYKSLEENNIQITKTFVSNDCIVTTPFDMILNNLIENSRGDKRHGSCGSGIHETLLRNEVLSLTVFDLLCMDISQLKDKLLKIRNEYVSKRLKDMNVKDIGNFKDVLYSESLINNFINDIYFMLEKIEISDFPLYEYDNIIFECGQGLLLDKSNTSYFPHLTPSNTGSINPINILLKFTYDVLNIEVCYVTRSYMTRHGAGRFDTECNIEDIGIKSLDKTNIPNEFQGILRYGYFDKDDIFFERINKDSAIWDLLDNKYCFTKSIAITHLNETDGKIFTKDKQTDDFLQHVKYLSWAEDRNGIKVQFVKS